MLACWSSSSWPRSAAPAYADPVTSAAAAFKGHGTENDFVVLPDLDASLSLSAELIRALCDRHAGIGADGVLRVVRTANATEAAVRAQAGVAEFFMDYRNADGSIAEMCGNGMRVFARYLQNASLINGQTTIATRGGPCEVSFQGDQISVGMGKPVLRAEHPIVTVTGLPTAPRGIAIDMPNPHVVVMVEDVTALNGLDLCSAPAVRPALPDGQNVEFVTIVGQRHLQMRVHERGVGETRSCGTGICAAVAALLLADWSQPAEPVRGIGGVPRPGSDLRSWQVDVPGGRCEVSWHSDGSVTLTGPAVLVAELELSGEWLADHG